ncbi:MAG: DUF1549 and DUF1553 domain-containing protein [Lentisphaeraceae bacterium]|nr:DUF1549 and DUF1553 domain-containing protein [Lentisphaeraceae bacterium]
MKILLTFVCMIACTYGNEILPDDIQKAQKNDWAYNLSKTIEVPQTEEWYANPIDSFIQEKLTEQGLLPSSRASKKTLVKRLYQTLTGLAPTYEEVQSFVFDNDTQAYEKLVDKLIASPRYGEKWGRHWLDVARYADGKGFSQPGQSALFPHAWSYRDYVIRAFNEDKPFNEFVKEQLAADLLDLKDKRDLAALGFIRLGQHYRDMKERQHEMVDVTTQAFLGLTVSCARCHDHKFDPIPTADYYSIFGIFKSISEPRAHDMPIIYESPDLEQRALFKVEMAKQEKKMRDFKTVAGKKLTGLARKYFSGYMSRISSKYTRKKPTYTAMRTTVNEFQKYLSSPKALESPLFKLWNQVIHNPKKAAEFVKQAKASKETTEELKTALGKLKKFNRNSVLDLYVGVAKELEKKPKKLQALMKPFEEVFTHHLVHNVKDLLHFVNSGTAGLKPKYLKLDLELQKTFSHPGAPAKAMIVKESSRPYNPYVFVRGQKDVRGPKVPRRYLQVLSKGDGVFKKGSGRLELAERLASKDNPLTARVIVNRVWSWNFGKGIVRTPNNFGALGGNPSHPELLDYMANWFMQNGWSIKKLQKMIVTSETFKQSSQLRPAAAKVDGENLLFWRKDPMRKSWEQLRDSIVQASGALKHKNGGAPIKLLGSNEASIRSIYGLINRRNLEGPMKYFDFPSTAVTCEVRTNTISPQQGLFLMNSEFSARYAQKIAESAEGDTDEDRTVSIYKKVLGRTPQEDEKTAALKFIGEARELYKNTYSRWEYGYGYLKGDKVSNFKPFQTFKNGRWQASEKYPDPVAGYAFLSAKGGHPGKGKNNAVIRRCNFYMDGTVRFTGKMIHPNKRTGDGVRVLILHNGKKVREWECKGKSVTTTLGEITVKKGDKIDLVVEPQKTMSGDTFEWPMEMSMNMNGSIDTWSVFDIFSNEQKSGITYSVWSCLAQTLTMSNEFIYVD